MPETEVALTEIEDNPLLMTWSDIRSKLNSVWSYLRDQAYPDHPTHFPDTTEMAIVRTAFNRVTEQREVAA